jgi:hypothetical protein
VGLDLVDFISDGTWAARRTCGSSLGSDEELPRSCIVVIDELIIVVATPGRTNQSWRAAEVASSQVPLDFMLLGENR